MTKQDFFSQLQEELEFETELTGETEIKETEEWDSLSAMVLIGFVSNNFGVSLKAEDIQQITTLDTLVDRIGVDKFQ